VASVNKTDIPNLSTEIQTGSFSDINEKKYTAHFSFEPKQQDSLQSSTNFQWQAVFHSLYRIYSSLSIVLTFYLLFFYYITNKTYCYSLTFAYLIFNLLWSMQILEYQNFINPEYFRQTNNPFKLKIGYQLKTFLTFTIIPRVKTPLSLSYNTLPIFRDLLVYFVIFHNSSHMSENLKSYFNDFMLDQDYYDDLISNTVFTLLCLCLLEFSVHLGLFIHRIFII
jgi:hypothetical protein